MQSITGECNDAGRCDRRDRCNGDVIGVMDDGRRAAVLADIRNSQLKLPDTGLMYFTEVCSKEERFRVLFRF